jgi:hypothetical protein
VVGAFSGGLRRAVGVSWRDGRCRGGLVQRGQGRCAAVVFLFSSMSPGRGLGRGGWGSIARRQGTLWEGHGHTRGVSPLLANSA